MDDIFKRVGAAIFGALEGIGIVAIIALMVFAAGNTDGAVFSLPVGWSVLGGILGAVICFCYPVASIAIFIGLGLMIKLFFIRRDN